MIEATLAEHGHGDPHIVAAVMVATSEGTPMTPLDVATVADLIGKIDDALAALPEASHGLGRLAAQDPERWGYLSEVARQMIEIPSVTVDQLGVELRTVAGLFDMTLKEIISDG